MTSSVPSLCLTYASPNRMYLSVTPSLSVTVTVMEGSAHLLGDRIQRVQDVHGQVACGLVAKLRVSLDGVLDEFKTLHVGRAENCWRSHRAVLFSRACFARNRAARYL